MLLHPRDIPWPTSNYRLSRGTQFTQAYVYMDGVLQKAFTVNLFSWLGPILKLENYSWNWPGGSYCPQGNPKLMGDRKQWINTPVSHPSDRQFWKAFVTLRVLKELSTYCSQYLSFPFSSVSMSSCTPAPQDPSSHFWSQEHPKWTTGTPVTLLSLAFRVTQTMVPNNLYRVGVKNLSQWWYFIS